MKQEIEPSVFTGTLWRFTPKGIKAGNDKNRVLAVVGSVKDLGKSYLLAWKCESLPGGKIKHPAYKIALAKDDERLFCTAGRNGSEPTHTFNPDSFYKRIK